MIDNFHVVKYLGQSKSAVEKEHLRNRQKLIDLNLFKPETES